MKGLGYVGSSGLASMVKVAETLSDQGGGIVLFESASALMVLIDTLGLGRYFSPVQTLEAALGKIHERRLAATAAKNTTAT
jgi:anti-anti-sigma regulatory factor